MKSPSARYTVAITRPKTQSAGICAILKKKGINVVEAPAIVIVPNIENNVRLKAALANLETYDWVIFTSVNAVNVFSNALKVYGMNSNMGRKLNICAIGPKTAVALKSNGFSVKKTAQTYVSEGIIPALGNVNGKKILVPCAKETREVLPETLRKRGARVNVVTIYRTVPAKKWPAAVINRFREGKVDCVTFTSASTVKFFFRRFPKSMRQRLFDTVALASIGPITTRAILEHKMKPAVEARKATVESLVEGIINYFKGFTSPKNRGNNNGNDKLVNENFRQGQRIVRRIGQGSKMCGMREAVCV